MKIKMFLMKWNVSVAKTKRKSKKSQTVRLLHQFSGLAGQRCNKSSTKTDRIDKSKNLIKNFDGNGEIFSFYALKTWTSDQFFSCCVHTFYFSVVVLVCLFFFHIFMFPSLSINTKYWMKNVKYFIFVCYVMRKRCLGDMC